MVSGDCAGVSGERAVVCKFDNAALGGPTLIAGHSTPRSRRSRLAPRARPFAAAVVALATFGVAAIARADTIATNTSGGFGTSNFAFGQSLTTPGGGPWNSIAFNFYLFPATSYASGNLYLLDHQYLGTLANLSSETNLGVATASANVWTFNPSVTLQANTQYWLYMGATSGTPLLWGSGDPVSGGNKYAASAAGTYGSEATNDMAFTLSGSQASPGPVPGAGLLSYFVLGFGGAAACGRRLRTGAAAALAMLKRRTPHAPAEAAG